MNIDIDRKNVFFGRFFTLSGFDHEESSAIRKEIEARGGLIDYSSNLRWTDCLIVRDIQSHSLKYEKAIQLKKDGQAIDILTFRQYTERKQFAPLLDPDRLEEAAELGEQKKAIAAAEKEARKKEQEESRRQQKNQSRQAAKTGETAQKKHQLGLQFRFSNLNNFSFYGSRFYIYGFSYDTYRQMYREIRARGGMAFRKLRPDITHVIVNEFAPVQGSAAEQELKNLNQDGSTQVLFWISKTLYELMIRQTPEMTGEELALLDLELPEPYSEEPEPDSVKTEPLLPPVHQQGLYLMDEPEELRICSRRFSFSGIQNDDWALISNYIEEKGGIIRKTPKRNSDYFIFDSIRPIPTQYYQEALDLRKEGANITLLSLDRFMCLTGLYKKRNTKERSLSPDGAAARRVLTDYYTAQGDQDGLLLINSMTSEDLVRQARELGTMGQALRSNHEGGPFAFISYAHRNTDTVLEILRRLQQEGCRLWYDEGIAPGKDWDEVLYSQILDSSVMLSFLSREYMASENCQDELGLAIEANKPVVCIALDDTELSKEFSVCAPLLPYEAGEEFYTTLFQYTELQTIREEHKEQNCDETIE